MAMAPSARRRRRSGRLEVPAVSPCVASLAAAGLLLLVVALYGLVSSPRAGEADDGPGLSPFLQLKNYMEVQRDAVATEGFVVPKGGGRPREDLWMPRNAKNFYGCSNASAEFAAAEAIAAPNRYLMIAPSGGLNQQRTGIVDAVVAARMLNATLVVPSLDRTSFWRDSSDFAEIFDVEWFISALSEDVKIVKRVPANAGARPYKMRIPRKCSPECYRSRVLPALEKKRVVQLTKFDYRLSNKMEPELQKMRCRANYHALRFAAPILDLGETLIRRMRDRSPRFIALHLRYEPDMLAFSGCYYGGGDREREELAALRKRWKSLRASNPEKQRRQGKCPLTPEEVGLMLRALGFGDDVHVYVASGELYGGEETLAPLKALFPNFHTKETLASKEELAPFQGFSSRLAALDFVVCDASDVLATNNNGNMARMLAGRRRYFGHKRTIRPNAKKLSAAFVNRTAMRWAEFAAKVEASQKGFMGDPGEAKAGEFYENPVDCICEEPGEAPPSGGGGGVDWREMDYGESRPLGEAAVEEAALDERFLAKLENPELDEV